MNSIGHEDPQDHKGPLVPDRYLGDGVYASFDGYHIVLDLRGQDSTTRVCLEPAVFDALVKFHIDATNARAKATTPQPAGGSPSA